MTGKRFDHSKPKRIVIEKSKRQGKDMNVVFIGSNPGAAQLATLGVGFRWPDVIPTIATTASEGLELVERTSPELVIICPDFSDMPAPVLLQDLRRFSKVPLLIISPEGGCGIEAITALELGADDYVRLPCELMEIIARMWAILRRSGILHANFDDEKPLRSGQLLINPATYEAFLGDEKIALTLSEFRLLHLLTTNRGRVVSHQTLDYALCGSREGGAGIAKKYVQRLRNKLGDDANRPYWIASVRGVGYRFVGPTASPVETS